MLVHIVAATVAVLTSGCDGGRSDAQSLPNILLVSIDTLRADHLGAYGYGRPTSPKLDQLARDGALFVSSYSQASSTVPSHASMFTGKFPFQHQSIGYNYPLRQEHLTLAEYLQQNGYRTLAVASSGRFTQVSGFAQGFDAYSVLEPDHSPKVVDLVAEELAKDSAKPVFAFAHFMDPHEPYEPPANLASKWHAGIPGLPPEDTSKFIQSHKKRTQRVDAETLAYLEALYDSEILYLDGELGRLFSKVLESKAARSTLIIVTSDHGEAFKEHGRLSHSFTLHEELVRVPLIYHWRGQIPENTIVERPAQGVDIFPTVIGLLGLERPPHLAGRSHAARLRGATGSEAGLDLILAEQGGATWAVSATLPRGRFKLIQSWDGVKRLYHLSDDPGERRNVVTQYPEEARRLEELAAAIGVIDIETGEPVHSASDTGDAPDVPPEVLDQLRAIGYAREIDEE